MRLKRKSLEDNAFSEFKKGIKSLSKREKLIAGLFLYWGEGTKASPYTVAMSNSDPDVLRFFIHWLDLLNVDKDRLRIALHLYKDMDIQKEIRFWSEYLTIPVSQFRKPYVKKSRLCDITYKSSFQHGTCNVIFANKEVDLYVRAGLKFIRTCTERHTRP